jgi:hypothetical protein
MKKKILFITISIFVLSVCIYNYISYSNYINRCSRIEKRIDDNIKYLNNIPKSSYLGDILNYIADKLRQIRPKDLIDHVYPMECFVIYNADTNNRDHLVIQWAEEIRHEYKIRIYDGEKNIYEAMCVVDPLERGSDESIIYRSHIDISNENQLNEIITKRRGKLKVQQLDMNNNIKCEYNYIKLNKKNESE